jgi:5-methylcytosine-specific restriction endonuclease McrA
LAKERRKGKISPKGWKPKGEVGLGKLIRNYENCAKARGWKFLLTREQIVEITKKNCHYCGSPPQSIMGNFGSHYLAKENNKHTEYVYNGIDRVDNSRGYEIENCVPCCSKCNHAKYKLSVEEFLSWVKRVYEFNFH